MDESKTFKQQQKWLTPPEFAKLIPSSPSSATVRAWAHKGLLPGAWRTPSGRWQIPVEAIDAISGGAA